MKRQPQRTLQPGSHGAVLLARAEHRTTVSEPTVLDCTAPAGFTLELTVGHESALIMAGDDLDDTPEAIEQLRLLLGSS